MIRAWQNVSQLLYVFKMICILFECLLGNRMTPMIYTSAYEVNMYTVARNLSY